MLLTILHPTILVMLHQFMMANGTLVRVLIHTNVTKYLNFKAVDGSYVYNKKKVRDSNAKQALLGAYS